MKLILLLSAAVFLAACQPGTDDATETEAAAIPHETMDSSARLASTLAAQPEDVSARYAERHPQETLEFFGIEPGMTVVEGLPGRGWYSRVLLPYLGDEGCLIGADYSLEMYPLFPFANEEFMEKQRNWKTNFLTGAEDWGSEDSASLEAFHFGSMPEEYAGTADVVFFPRVLHNLANFEEEGGYLTAALHDAFSILKPGGVFGVVQHEARDNMPDEFADGSHGYLKKAFVIAVAEKAGFEYVAESDVNQNPKDQPTETDIVWRLSPTFFTSRDDPELKETIAAIGESNRMTLKFRKPE